MEYNKTQIRLEEYISFYKRTGQHSVKWDEYRELEIVYKNNYLAEELEARAIFLHQWMFDIGKQVFKSNENFNYVTVNTFSKLDSLNQKYFDTSKSIEFTKELFDKLCFDYCNYQVKRFTEELLEKSITSNSTCKMSNLIFEWQLECKQELIKIFKELCN